MWSFLARRCGTYGERPFTRGARTSATHSYCFLHFSRMLSNSFSSSGDMGSGSPFGNCVFRVFMSSCTCSSG